MTAWLLLYHIEKFRPGHATLTIVICTLKDPTHEQEQRNKTIAAEHTYILLLTAAHPKPKKQSDLGGRCLMTRSHTALSNTSPLRQKAVKSLILPSYTSLLLPIFIKHPVVARRLNYQLRRQLHRATMILAENPISTGNNTI